MSKLKPAFFVLLICAICFLILCLPAGKQVISGFAEESLTITTYYPSPYGSYRELRSQRIAIGDNYIDGGQYCWEGACTNTINANADLVVEGNVGIGTPGPESSLHVRGNDGMITIEDNNSAAKFSIAAGSGNHFYIDEGANRRLAIVGGDVGIGTPSPGAKLDVNGDIRWIQPFNTGLLDNTTESSAQENVLLTAGCIKRNNENYSADHWMSCPRGFYVAAITDDESSAQDVLCCPF